MRDRSPRFTVSRWIGFNFPVSLIEHVANQEILTLCPTWICRSQEAEQEVVDRCHALLTMLGCIALFQRVHQPNHRSRSPQQYRRRNKQYRRDQFLLASNEFLKAITPARRPNPHRLAAQVMLDVLRQRAGAVISTRAILLQTSHHDPVGLT